VDPDEVKAMPKEKIMIWELTLEHLMERQAAMIAEKLADAIFGRR